MFYNINKLYYAGQKINFLLSYLDFNNDFRTNYFEWLPKYLIFNNHTLNLILFMVKKKVFSTDGFKYLG